MVITRTVLENFRSDFNNTVKELEKKYGVNIQVGTIRFDESEFRFKVTAQKGNVIPKVSKNEFMVGDKVRINHKKTKGKLFEVVKILTKNIRVKDNNGNLLNVSPSLLVRI